MVLFWYFINTTGQYEPGISHSTNEMSYMTKRLFTFSRHLKLETNLAWAEVTASRKHTADFEDVLHLDMRPY